MINLKLRNLLLLCLTVASISLYAAQTTITTTSQETPPATTTPAIPWASNGATDKVTIENGNGAELNIVISVNDDASSDPAGINVQNCGDTKHIDAGSSAICVTNDADHPVTFSSDKERAATGTYLITQQLPKK